MNFRKLSLFALFALLAGAVATFFTPAQVARATYNAYTVTRFPGDIRIDKDLMVAGGNILDSGGTTRITLGATNTITGNCTITGTLTNGSMSAMATPAVKQVIGAGDTVAADSCGTIKRIDATANRTTSTSHTFTTPAAGNTGCFMWVVNVGTQTITLDNNSEFVSASAGDVALGPNDACGVVSDGTAWYQTSAKLDN